MTAAQYEHLFPRFHVRPSSGFVNDPNGPLLLGDELHLYYQYRADAGGAGPVLWGHATSTDFVTWRYHRPAIAPQPYGPDRDGCWSGTTIIADNKVVALYAGFVEGVAHQPVVLAESHDGGFSFRNGQIVVSGPADSERVAHFRDPFVWREQEAWRMLVGAGAEEAVASARLYESSNLVDWAPCGSLSSMTRNTGAELDTGVMWECPQLAKLGDTDVLIVSPWAPGEELKPVLTIGNPAGTADVGRLDHGSSFYAASVLRDSPFGPLVWGWAPEARANDWCIETDWSGMLTLPRCLGLAHDNRVTSRPIPALKSLRRAAIDPTSHVGKGAAKLDSLPAQFELRARIASRADDLLRIRLAFSADEWFECEVNPTSGQINLDTSSASSDPRAFGSRIAFHDPAISDGSYTLTLYVDGSIIEAFTSGGRCATVRAYPTATPPWTIDIDGLNPSDTVSAWDLRPPDK